MDTEDTIVPLCLYSSPLSSYISFPAKVREGDKTVLRCDPAFQPSYNSDKEFITTFYVINPDIHPIPSGMDLLCIQNASNSSTDIKQLYDPFNTEEKCIRFLAWLEPTPFTTPLYVYKSKNNMRLSFDSKPPTPDYKPALVPSIYVLIDPRMKDVYRVPAPRKPEVIGDKTSFAISPEGIPVFTFSGYQERCIPDPNGRDLKECIVITDKDVLRLDRIGYDKGLLNYLQERYGKKRTFSLWIGAILIGFLLLWFYFSYTN